MCAESVLQMLLCNSIQWSGTLQANHSKWGGETPAIVKPWTMLGRGLSALVHSQHCRCSLMCSFAPPARCCMRGGCQSGQVGSVACAQKLYSTVLGGGGGVRKVQKFIISRSKKWPQTSPLLTPPPPQPNPSPTQKAGPAFFGGGGAEGQNRKVIIWSPRMILHKGPDIPFRSWGMLRTRRSRVA